MMQMERWTLLIVREAMLRGATRFADFQYGLGVAPDLLAARLDDLVAAQVLEVTASSEYILTARGWDLEPTISALSQWSDKWNFPAILTPERAAHLALARDMEHIVSAREKPRFDAPSPPGVPIVDTPGEGVPIRITVLGAFAITVGGKTIGPLSSGSQRLLVFLALHDRVVGRAAMAGRMWPDATDERAGISLRSALSRLDTDTREAILSASADLSLADAVTVDLRSAQALARRLLDPSVPVRSADLSASAVAALSRELLPDWYDDWVVAEAEDWRQLRMSALEALSESLVVAGRLADAAGAARAAMKVEPLRESAHATLIRVHLAEGNQSEALRVYDRYSVLLSAALGLEPTERLSGLVSSIRS
jgi:DNA-binding SARP family transcriptional activator/DNA-binding HxlR family transcriptional regulator